MLEIKSHCGEPDEEFMTISNLSICFKKMIIRMCICAHTCVYMYTYVCVCVHTHINVSLESHNLNKVTCSPIAVWWMQIDASR